MLSKNVRRPVLRREHSPRADRHARPFTDTVAASKPGSCLSVPQGRLWGAGHHLVLGQAHLSAPRGFGLATQPGLRPTELRAPGLSGKEGQGVPRAAHGPGGLHMDGGRCPGSLQSAAAGHLLRVHSPVLNKIPPAQHIPAEQVGQCSFPVHFLDPGAGDTLSASFPPGGSEAEMG